MLQNLIGTISPKKHQSFYRYFHPYFTRLAPNVVSEYIRHFTKKGDVVLDPFCGSGTVGMEALLAGRQAISSDISPLAIFISRELTNNKIDIKALLNRFSEIESQVTPTLKKIWSYGNEQLYQSHNPYFEKLKNDYWYPTNRLSYRSNIASVDALYDVRQLLTYAVLFDAIQETKSIHVKNSLLVTFFGTMSRVNLTYMVSGTRTGSILHNGGSSLFSFYDYRRPKSVVVIPVWERFRRKFEDIIKIKEKTADLFSSLDQTTLAESKTLKIDVKRLHEKLPLNSVDYIFTDPPYGGKIPYLELASMWSSWMGWSISSSDLESEIIEGGELHKNQSNYLNLMSEGMASMCKVLKPNGMLSLVFQHNDLAVWKNILEIARSHGLEFVHSSIQPTNSASIIKKKFKGGIVSVPLIINFKKDQKRIKRNQSSKKALAFSFELASRIEHFINLKHRSPTYEDIYNIVTKLLFDSNFSYDLEAIQSSVRDILEKHGIDQLFHIVDPAPPKRIS